MANLGKVIYINETDYSTLLNGGSITKGGTTYTYDSTALYVIKDVSAPEYAETAGYATEAGRATTAEQATKATQDANGNIITATYDKKPLVIEANDTDQAVPSGTFASITAAIAAGRDVVVKVTRTDSDAEIEYCRLEEDYARQNGTYCFTSIRARESFLCVINSSNEFYCDISVLAHDSHVHGDITNDGDIIAAAPTIANGDQIVINDQSASRITNGPTFDGSTTTQALSKKGTWETFYQKPSTGIPATDLTSAAQTSLGKADTSVQDVKVKVGTGTAVSIVDSNKVANVTLDTTPTANSTNTVTSSGIKTALDTKVAKVTSTDNAIARFDGTGGQIQNSGVTINDSNQVTAAKFITSGGTSSQFVKGDGSLDSGHYIKDGDTIHQKATSGNNYKLRVYDTDIQDSFWGANKRFVVTHKVYNVSDDSYIKDISTDLFKHNYEAWGNGVAEGQYAELYIGKTEDPVNLSGYMFVYGQGNIYLSFYAGKYPGEILEAKAYFKDSNPGWNDCTIREINSLCYRVAIPNRNYLAALKIKYTGITPQTDTSKPTSLTDIAFIRMRDVMQERNIVTKYPYTQELYGNVEAPKFITRGGTSAQFVKGDGTLDSTSTAANSLLSSLPDWTATPTDTTKLVRRDTGGSASFGQVTFLSVWNYIKDKISSILGIGGDNGTPTAPTAASGTNTTQIATTAFVQSALSNMGAGGSEMVDVTITGTTSSASFSTNPYNAIKAIVNAGKIAVLNANVAPLSTTGVLIPVYEYTYSQSGSNYTGYKGSIQHSSYEITVDVKSTSSATVTITEVSATITVDTALSETSTNPVQNKAITAQILENEEIVATALNNLNDRVEAKQDVLVSGTTIKTINGNNILGSGNITISGGSGGGGDVNVIETVKVNGTALVPDANKAVDVEVKTIDGNSITGSGNLTVFPEIAYNDLNTLEELGIYKVGTSYICTCTSSGPPSSPFYTQTLIGEGNIRVRSGNSLPITSSWTTALYSKPSGGIPATDLASAVQTSLGKADTALQPDVDNDLAQGTISSSNSQGFNYIIADKDTSSEQTLQDALDAKASTSAVNVKYTKPSGGIPDTDLTTAVNMRLLAQLSSSSDDGKIMKYSYSGGGWQAVKPVTIYSGSSAPSSSTGSNGDIYIQTS